MKFKFLKAALAGLIFTSSCIVNLASAGLILDENFDPITPTDWTILGGFVLGTPSSEFFDGNALYFNGASTRSATTNSYDLTSGGIFSFMLKIGAGSGLFENADGGEDIALQYTTNGVSFSNLLVLDTEDVLYRGTWGNVSFAIDASSAVASTTTAFRIAQLQHSGSSFDRWAIDDVQLSTNVPEPSTLVIFSLGIIGLASRRFNK